MDTSWLIVVAVVGGAILAIAFMVAIGMLRGVYSRSQTEKKKIFLEGEKKFSRLFNAVSDCVYEHTPDGIVTEVNESFSAAIGRPIGEILGASLIELIGPKSAPRITQYLEQCRTMPGELSGLVRIVRRDVRDHVFYEFKSHAVSKEGAIPQIQGIARNVTGQIKYERSLRRSERRMKLLLEHSQLMRRNLEIVSREMLMVQEAERLRITRELHDEIGQLLTTMTFNLELIRNKLPRDHDETLSRRVVDTEKLASEMFGRIRRFILELRPVGLDDLGLLALTRRLLKDFTDRSGIDSRIHGDAAALDLLSPDTRHVIYRCIQESLTNISRHADASSVALEVCRTGSDVVLKITDDGKGFDLSQIRSGTNGRRGMGLLGMEERIKLIGGKNVITSSIGSGTIIEMTVPQNGSDDPAIRYHEVPEKPS